MEQFKGASHQLLHWLMEIDAAIGTASETEAISYAYSQMKDISVDYGVMEKAKEVLVIPMDNL